MHDKCQGMRGSLSDLELPPAHRPIVQKKIINNINKEQRR